MTSLRAPVNPPLVFGFFLVLGFRSLASADDTVFVRPLNTGTSQELNSALNPPRARDNDLTNFARLTSGAPNLVLATTAQVNLGAVTGVTLHIVNQASANTQSGEIHWASSSSTVHGSAYAFTAGASIVTSTFVVTSERKWNWEDFAALAIHARWLSDADGANDVRAYEVYFVVQSTPRVKAVSAETLDDNANGQIDAFRITLSSPIVDSTVGSSAPGFAVGGSAVGLVYSPAGLINFPDAADDNVIYIRFPESGTPDTAQVPQITYSLSGGTVKDAAGLSLDDVLESTLVEQDKAPPALVDAKASDASGGGINIQTADEVQLVFSENTNQPVIDASNINNVLQIQSWGQTWGNSLNSAIWIAPSVFKVALKVDGAPDPNFDVGASTRITTRTNSTPTIQDAAGNISTSSIALGGNFGADSIPPVIGSRETQDQDLDGFIDVVKITFTEAVRDSSMTASIAAGRWSVSGASGLSFDTGAASSDTVALIRFTDGVLGTAQTPNVVYTKGAAGIFDNVVDMAATGNELASNSGLAADSAGPVLLSAVASDNSILAPEVDGDDSVQFVFSEPTNRPILDSSNINTVLALTPATHTWGDVTTTWDSQTQLTVRFNCPTDICGATLVAGDIVTVSGGAILDLAVTGANAALGTKLLGGSFAGVDTASPTIVSVFPQDQAVGVSVSTVVVVTFSERMVKSQAQDAVSLTAVLDQAGQALDASVSAAVVYSTATQKLTLTPDAALSAGFTYQIVVTTQATDNFGIPLASSGVFRFATLMDSSQANAVLGSDGKVLCRIPAGALSQSVSVEVNENALSAPRGTTGAVLNTAESKFNTDRPSGFDQLIPSSAREIVVRDGGGAVVSDFLSRPADVTLPYSETGGIVNGTSPGVREESLKMYTLDTDHSLWVPLAETSIDTAQNTVTGKVYHFSFFVLAGTSDVDLSPAFAFPVPFRPARGDKEITFTALSPQATIEIFTLAGEKVKTIQHASGANQLAWDVRNEKGSLVASGVYHYVIKNASSMKKGKLVIVR